MAQKIEKAKNINSQILSGELSQSELVVVLAEFMELEVYVARYGSFEDLANVFNKDKIVEL